MSVFVLIGPGGAGKGTVAAQLIARDPRLWLSRSWTTRARRAGEAEDAYVFVTPEAFRAHVEAGGFLEWAEFLGNLYGTPVPDPPPGSDVLLEIDVQGAEQVVAARPEAVVILLVPPSDQIQAARLLARGETPERALRRVEAGHREIERGRKLARFEVVNQTVDQAVEDVAGIVSRIRGKDADAP